MAVYFIRAQGTNRVKIGWALDPERRRKALQTGNAEPLVIFRTERGDRQDEAAFHRLFAEHRMSGEWFGFHPDMLTASPAPLPPKPAATPLRECVAFLGGQAKAAATVGRSQCVVSEWISRGHPSVEACMLLELATLGRWTAEQLRPDKADLFRAFKASAIPPALREAA